MAAVGYDLFLYPVRDKYNYSDLLRKLEVYTPHRLTEIIWDQYRSRTAEPPIIYVFLN